MLEQVKSQYEIVGAVPHGRFEDLYFEGNGGLLFLICEGVDGFTICLAHEPTKFKKVNTFEDVVKFVA